jgi:hypothetical protein
MISIIQLTDIVYTNKHCQEFRKTQKPRSYGLCDFNAELLRFLRH